MQVGIYTCTIKIIHKMCYLDTSLLTYLPLCLIAQLDGALCLLLSQGLNLFEFPFVFKLCSTKSQVTYMLQESFMM